MEGILEEIGKMLDEKLASITNMLGIIEHSLSNLSEEVEKDLFAVLRRIQQPG